MRLDKYLKVSRLIKRRTVANEACDAGRVLVNGRPARASYDVKGGRRAGSPAGRPDAESRSAGRERNGAQRSRQRPVSDAGRISKMTREGPPGRGPSFLSNGEGRCPATALCTMEGAV